MSLKDFLKFAKVASPLPGATALTPSSRPTKSGIKLLAVPANCVGYAFRVCNDTLETLTLSSETGASVLFSTSLGIPAVNVAASPDGRLVAVCLADGSLCCFDVTHVSFQLRWKVEGAHSHTETDLNQSVSKSRDNAAGAAGPARSLQFSPHGYALALVDDGQQGLTIYHADDCGTPVESVQRQLAHLNLACAAWSPSCDSDECTIAVGTIDGNGIHVFNYNITTSRLSPVGVLPFPGEADDGPSWSCTHIEWVADGRSLGCGYCRVLPPEEDVEEDEDNPEDAAQHHVCFYISSFPSDEKPPQDMGDVVPFFAPAKDGRHVFFTTTVANNSQCNIMLVASNVGSDVHVLAGEDPSSWVEVELPEGDNALTPTDDDYEYTYPTGLAVANIIQEGVCLPLVLLLSTDGSLSCFQLVHGANESFFQLPLASGVNHLHAVPLPKSMRSEAAPELVTEDASPPVTEVKSNLFGQETKASFGFGGLSLASTPPKSSLEASEGQQSVFGASTSSQTSSVTTAPTSSLSFGTASAFGANAPSSTQPVFGQTSSLLGPQSAPFGSGSEVTFGSGTASLSFGSGAAKNVFGSSVLSSKPFSFEALASSPAGFAQSADPFNTFKKPASSAFGLASIAKPLFDSTTEETKQEEKPELSSTLEKAPSPVLPVEPAADDVKLGQDLKSDKDESASTPEVKKAAEAFDTIDSDKKGILPLDKMEDLIELLGEGFYGDELEKQTKLVDKDDKGHLERQAFIDWYLQLLSGDDDGGSSGGSEESDQREERERAQAKFRELSSMRDGVRSITEMDFPKLIESFGTTYCEEEHRKTIRKLKDSSGIITENAFVSWYLDWLFGGDESDIEDSEEEENEVDGVVTSESVATGTGWGNLFKAEEGSWKCSVCMVSNPGETGKCKACEAVRPGTENDAATTSMGTGSGTQESSGSSIGANGFSFGGGAISSCGFSFSSGGASSSPAPALLAGVSSGFSFKPSGSTNISIASNDVEISSDPSAQVSKFTIGDVLSNLKSAETHGDEIASTPEVKKAAEAFDTIDSDKKGILPLDKMEDLIELLGEGFYGDELEKQTKLVDKDDKGHLERQAFIDWYLQLLSGDDDGGSSGGSEESDQREERERAQAKFRELSSMRDGVRSITEMDFPKLIESFGTTYCEEEHRKTIRKLKDSSGIITENAFVSWYLDWLFGGDESDIEDSEEEENEVDGVVTSESVATGTGWGNLFKAEEGSWKCSVCMVSNPGETGKCKACEAVRPGTENDAATTSMGTGSGTQESSGSTIGANGFSFGGGAISSCGFSFSSGGASSSPAPALLAGVSSGFSFKPSGSSDASSSHALQSVSEETKTTSLSSAFPPMSSEAPNPFAASNERTKTASTSSSSAFPPMSYKTPTPFSASSGTSVFGSSESKSVTSSSAFPPMSSKAPTPFAASNEGTKTALTSSSSAFPPMSNKAPTPFSAAGTSAIGSSESKKATSSSAFPPISSKAPTPFSASGDGTKTAATSPSSAFPPMSSKAPTPFSAPGTSAIGSSESKSVTSSSAFPPMSSKAPTPFSASGDGTKTISTSSSSAFPPMSSKAPTPFSAGTSVFGSSESKSATSSSSSFPPMSSKAPTPFSASGDGTKTASTSSSSAFPPMSSKAPTPFSAAGTSAFGSAESKSVTSSSAFPPMSSKAPTPFSASGDGTKTASTSSSSAFPPMSSKAPTPFSAAGTSAFGSSESKKATSSSAFPPMFSKAPTPFSASGEGTKTAATSSSSAIPPMSSMTSTHLSATTETNTLASFPQAQRGIGRVPLSIQDSVSEVAAQYAVTVKRMEERLEVLSQMRSKNDDSELKAAISTVAKNNHELLVSFSNIQSSLLHQKQRGVKMLSHKATASMRVNECEKYLTSFLASEIDSASLLKVQPLDVESESRRREISSAAMTLHRSIIALKSRAKLLHELQEVDGDMRLLVTINETRKKLQAVEEDATRVERRIRNAVDCGQDIKNRLPSHRTTKDRSIQAGKGNYKNEVNWKNVENHLSTFSEMPRKTKLELSLESQIVKKKSLDERKPLLSSTGKHNKKQLQLFSPPISLHPRAGWDEPSTVDQAKMQALTYSAPSQLKSFAIDSAARGALSDFGTTPERVRDAFAVSNNTGSIEARNESLSSKIPIRDLASKSPRSKLSESPSKKDGLKPSKIIDFPNESFKSTFTLKDDSDPPLSFSHPKDAPAETSEENTFGLKSMHGLGTMLFTDTKKSGTKSSLFEIQPSGSADQVDFHKLLTEFYTEHNASKLSEVSTVLLKYKGRESEMFAKLAKRYGVANPLENRSDVSISADKSNALFPSEQTSNAQMPFQQKPSTSQSPFGGSKMASSASTLGSPGLSGSSIQDSKPVFGGFGSTSTSNFGSSTTSPLPFGGNTGFSASQSPFSAPPSNTPFGSASITQAQSTSAPMFNGKSARELLIEFYRNHNPAKVEEADRLLEKYHGNEEALFRNLAKKYNLDPSIFGLTSPPAPAPGGFGSHSSLGTGGLGGITAFGGVASTPTPFGSSGFGSASPLGQSSVFGSAPVTASNTPSGSVFGSAAGSTSFGASGFGSLAQSSPSQGFGSFGSPQPTATFGASSPFGAPRR